MKDLLFDEDYFEAFSQLEEDDTIPVIPMQKVLYPYESRHEEVSNPKLLKVLLEMYGNKRCVGMLYNAAGGKSLPAVGSIGTVAAFGMQKITGDRYIVKYIALPRFTVTAYLEENTLYPQSEYELFFDDKAVDEDETLSAAEHLVYLMKETERVRGFKKKFGGDPQRILDSPNGAVALSFFVMKFWGGLHETRHHMLNLRSTVERLKYAIHLVSEYNKNEAVAERLRHNN